MKKTVIGIISAVILFSFVGCSTAPSDEKIKRALDEGTITVEDAKERGWIDEEWIEEHFETVESGTKVQAFDAFETTYIDGTPVSSDIISGKMCLVFFDTSKENTMDKLNVYNEVTSELKELGIPVLGVVTDKQLEGVQEKLKDMTFPVIVFNEKMSSALQGYQEIIDTDVVSVFTRDGGFYSSWNGNADKEIVMKFARSFTNEE